MSLPADVRDQLSVQDPGLIMILPLVYVAWADGLLTPSEIETIRERVCAMPHLSRADQETVEQWLDPQRPPSTTTYLGWLRTIRTLIQHTGGTSTGSVSGLCAQLAGMVDAGAHPSESLEALADIEQLLGLGLDAASELIDEPRPAPPDTGLALEPPAFDVAAMKSALDGRHEALRDKIRRLLSDPIFQYPVAPSTDDYRERVLLWCRLLADQGLGALAFPEGQGGSGSVSQFITALETIAYHDLSLTIKYGVQFGLWGGSVHQLGTERHHQQYLPGIGSLELPGSFAMTELGHGSNVRELETVALYDRETKTFLIDTPSEAGRKEYIGNAARHARLATVFAQLMIDGEGYGVHAFIVPVRKPNGSPMPGVRIADNGHKLGLNGVDNGRLWFDKVRVPREALLNRFADVSPDGTYTSPIPSAGKRFFTMLSTLVGGRIGVAAGAVSAAKSGLTIAIRYGERRRQFGPKGDAEVRIMDYKTHQLRLLPLLANAYALTFALDDLRERFAVRTSKDADEIEARAAGLKAFSTWNTTHTLQTCREACGGQGYLAENRFAALKADTDIFTTFEGDNTVLMLQVAKALLSDFKREFRDMNVFGMMRYLAADAETRLKELNPVITRKTDADHLRSVDYLSAAFAYRERRLVVESAKRMKKRMDSGQDPFWAFVEVQDQLVELAQAHVDRIVHDHFAERIAGLGEDLRPVLDQLRALFGLNRMHQDIAWFMEHNYVSDAKARAIKKQVRRLCHEIRPQALHLVDAFAIPDELLAAPIGLAGNG
ncbi:MAG: acyl-CoA dehydrogenase [Bacteroidota bacterium]